MKRIKVKSVVNALFEFYSKYISDLYLFCVLLTSATFVISSVLYKYSNYGKDYGPKSFNFYDAIFSKFSYQGVYSIVDFSKTIYLFLATLLTVTFFRQVKKPSLTTSVFKIFFQNIRLKDVFTLIAIAAVACIADVFLFQSDSKLKQAGIDPNVYLWLHYILSILRLNIPLIVLGMAVAYLVITTEIEFKGLSLITLIICVWLYNEFAYEVSAFIGSIVIYAVGMCFKDITLRYVVESILYIPIFAFFMPGYAAVLYYPFRFFEKQVIAK